MTPIRAADLPVSLWKNGAGRKADIAGGPGWHVGYAWLDRDAPFSDYAGHDRTITLVEGPGFSLVTPSGEVAVRADAPFRPSAFDGGLAVSCVIAGGPCRVLNVMTERALVGHRIELVGSGVDVAGPAPGEIRFVVALKTGCSLATPDASLRLGMFDAVQLDGPGRIETDGLAAVITLA